MKDGKCNYFIENRSYDVVSGDIILIPAGTIHRTNYSPKPHSRHLINFSEDFISPEILEAAKTLGYLYSNKSLSAHINAIFDMIEAEYLRNDPLSIHALKAYTEQLLLLMIRNGNEKKRESDGNAIVEKTVRYIQENYMKIKAFYAFFLSFFYDFLFFSFFNKNIDFFGIFYHFLRFSFLIIYREIFY